MKLGADAVDEEFIGSQVRALIHHGFAKLGEETLEFVRSKQTRDLARAEHAIDKL